MLKRLNINHYDVVILTLILVSRLILLFMVYPEKQKMFNVDSFVYERLATEFIQNGVYQCPGLEDKFMAAHSDMIRPPGYPAFLIANYWLFGIGNFLAPVLWNFVGLILLYFGIENLFRRFSILPEKLIFIFFALDLSWLIYSKDIVVEPIFTPIFVWSIIFYIDGLRGNTKRLLISGFLFAICALLKPIALYLPVLLTGFLLFRTRSKISALYFTAIFLLGISPWIIRNKIAHDTFSFTSLQSNNLALGHIPYVYADIHKLPYFEAQDSVMAILDTLSNHLPVQSYNAFDSLKTAFAVGFIREHPWRYAKVVVLGMAVTMFDPGREALNRTFPIENVRIGFTQTLGSEGISGTFRQLLQKDWRLLGVLGVYFLFLCGLNVLMLAGIAPFWRGNCEMFVLIAMTLLYLLVLGGPNGYARFRLYIFPLQLVFVNYGIVWMRNWRKEFIDKPQVS